MTAGAGREAMDVRIALDSWTRAPDTAPFPYQPVLAEYHRVGKEFVDNAVLGRLVAARALLERPGGIPGERLLRSFLSTALDKYDDRYDYRTYLAMDVLDFPNVVDALDGVGGLGIELRRCDWMIAALLSDVVRFELAAMRQPSTPLPNLRPDARTAIKRCRLAVKAAECSLRRLEIPVGAQRGDLAELSGRLESELTACAAGSDPARRRLSMFPVYTDHDEWMFIRVLQMFEFSFVRVILFITHAIHAIEDRRPRAGAAYLASATAALEEAAPQFSLVATMQPDAFRDFRKYTEGASAIQSDSYKALEALCRIPDGARLASAAFASTPAVQARIQLPYRSLDEAVLAAWPTLTISARETMNIAMDAFADRLRRWRQTHYRLARRLLGDRTGTGYTQGVPYLADVRSSPVFHGSNGPPTPCWPSLWEHHGSAE